MRKNKEKLRQYKKDSMNPILKTGFFLYVRFFSDSGNKYEIQYFDTEEKLRKYLTDRFASTPGRRLHEYYIEKLISGDEVTAKLDNGEGTIHMLRVFHDENVIELFSVLRLFLITAKNALQEVKSVEEMQNLIREYNEILSDPPKISTIYND